MIGVALPPDPVAAHQASKGLHCLYLFDRNLPKVCRPEPCKVFSRCEPLQTLMGPDVVVEGSEFIKRALQCTAAGDDQLPEQWFERAKQTLDPAVLPRRMLLGGLVPDARDFQEGVEQPAVEHRFVVGAQFAGFAVLCNGQAQVPQHGPAAAACEGVQAQCQARSVVDDADGWKGNALRVGEERHVHGPGVVNRHSAGFC